MLTACNCQSTATDTLSASCWQKGLWRSNPECLSGIDGSALLLLLWGKRDMGEGLLGDVWGEASKQSMTRGQRAATVSPPVWGEKERGPQMGRRERRGEAREVDGIGMGLLVLQPTERVSQINSNPPVARTMGSRWGFRHIVSTMSAAQLTPFNASEKLLHSFTLTSLIKLNLFLPINGVLNF